VHDAIDNSYSNRRIRRAAKSDSTMTIPGQGPVGNVTARSEPPHNEPVPRPIDVLLEHSAYNLSSCVDLNDSMYVGGGASSDVYSGHCKVPQGLIARMRRFPQKLRDNVSQIQVAVKCFRVHAFSAEKVVNVSQIL
jgi:hypothetical protein